MYILQYSIIGNEARLIDNNNGKLKLLAIRTYITSYIATYVDSYM